MSYIRGLRDEDLRHIAPLPYRRVLTERQSARWRAALAERWDAHPREHYWYPLHSDSLPPDVLPLQHRNFLLEVAPAEFRSLFFRRGITRVFQFVENQIVQRDYELDMEWVVPGGAERFWTSRELDWVVYTSHESSITFAGDWLIEGIKEIWPNWQQRIYTDWYYASNMEQAVWETSRWFREARFPSP